jgi:hypothetical protein
VLEETTDERCVAGHRRYLANADSKAVAPTSPAAQKFRLLMLRKTLDSNCNQRPIDRRG